MYIIQLRSIIRKNKNRNRKPIQLNKNLDSVTFDDFQNAIIVCKGSFDFPDFSPIFPDFPSTEPGGKESTTT